LIFIKKGKKVLLFCPFGKGFDVNTAWIDPFARPVIRDFVLSTTSAKMSHTIAAVVSTVYDVGGELGRPNHGGARRDTRKRMPAIVVGLGQDMPHN